MIDVKSTDKIFDGSPNAGDKNCICSRCGNVIQEDELPLRMWTENERGEIDEKSKEYRFCESCQRNAGIKI